MKEKCLIPENKTLKNVLGLGNFMVARVSDVVEGESGCKVLDFGPGREKLLVWNSRELENYYLVSENEIAARIEQGATLKDYGDENE